MVMLYADGASLSQMEKYAADERIKGFTTNPSLMLKQGIKDYRSYAQSVLVRVKGKPVSFEVLADDFPTMAKQAREIASWAPNVYVKIPVTNTKGESSVPLIKDLGDLNLNITAVMTRQQLNDVCPWLQPHHILSVFAGRIMDTGRLPPGFKPGDSFKALWASAREMFNIVQAENFGYDIITLTPDLLAKIDMRGYPLDKYSLETVAQFHRDGQGIEL